MIVLVPVPTPTVEQTYPMIHPYLIGIAERSGDDIMEMQRMLMSGETQAFFVWDDENKKTKAFIGVSYIAHGETRTGRIIWLVGEDRKAWLHLWAELEKYLKDAEHCRKIEAIARPGWKPHLEVNGFKVTHILAEKDI